MFLHSKGVKTFVGTWDTQMDIWSSASWQKTASLCIWYWHGWGLNGLSCSPVALVKWLVTAFSIPLGTTVFPIQPRCLCSQTHWDYQIKIFLYGLWSLELIPNILHLIFKTNFKILLLSSSLREGQMLMPEGEGGVLSLFGNCHNF